MLRRPIYSFIVVRSVKMTLAFLVGASVASAAVALLTDDAYFLLPILLLSLIGPVGRLGEIAHHLVLAARGSGGNTQLGDWPVHADRPAGGSRAASLVAHGALLALGIATLTGVVLRGGDGTHPL
jgi:hypothetical protein